MEAILLNVGDELLIGQVVNTNASWLGDQLNDAGIDVREILIVKDELEDIKEALNYTLSKVPLVLMTGGLGPTKDDITKKAIAEYFNVSMNFDEDTYNRIIKLFERIGKTPTPSHKEQSYMPDNAQLLFNKMGTAPGMWFNHKDKVLVSMPGVPYEMKWIFENSLMEKIHERFQTKAIYHKTILTIGMGESKIAEKIQPIIDTFPSNLKIAYLPSLGSVRLRLTGMGDDKEAIIKLVIENVDKISKEIPELIFGYNKTPFEQYMGTLLLEKQLKLATAESCTGGYLAHKITAIPGSSYYYSGSVISYSNEMKMASLSVNKQTLETYGAVSEETVLEMLEGLLNSVNADVGISISGIAGPDGGTKEKPVGTIWICVGSKTEKKTEKLQLGKNRITNIQYTSLHALNMLRKFLLAQ
jgi:nicotinamide-nucleotide amidase